MEKAPYWPRPVVDENVDDESCALSGGEDLLGSSRIVEVGNDDARLGGLGGELGGEGFEAIAAARSEDKFCAVGGQLTREGRADSGAGPGD